MNGLQGEQHLSAVPPEPSDGWKGRFKRRSWEPAGGRRGAPTGDGTAAAIFEEGRRQLSHEVEGGPEMPPADPQNRVPQEGEGGSVVRNPDPV